MDPLLHNPIADLYGPYFLVVYAAIIAVVAVGAAWEVRRGDATAGLAPPPIPAKVDPYEVAYLRGGGNELTRLIVFDLIRRGYLRAREGSDPKIERALDLPGLAALSPPEREAFAYFTTPRRARALLGPGELAHRLRPHVESIRDALRDRQLIPPAETGRLACVVGASGGALVAAIGLYKLVIAQIRGHHNVAFLILMMIAGLVAVGLASRPPRRTRLGRDFLERLRQAFEGLGQKQAGPALAAADPRWLLTLGLFGVAALKDTPFAHVHDLFRASALTGGGCGAGAGCGGGGGCGGGCGGGVRRVRELTGRVWA
ncbi:MAG TPA: TIGR04222 domain-containing membrane protein [Isosphaeraceae bacterium]|jgi:uncharacterized protein (TIGR04222 family)|nr:TIGR04222 domain-containing membrane protein [Isosphaeraceae bacterium]